MSKFKIGDRVRVDEPMILGEPNIWHGKVGTVTANRGWRPTPAWGSARPAATPCASMAMRTTRRHSAMRRWTRATTS